MLDLFTTRKIISGLVLLSVGLIVTYFKSDIPNNLLALMQWLYVSFCAANSAQHVSSMIIDSKQK